MQLKLRINKYFLSFLILLNFLLIQLFSYGQFYNSGQDRGSIKWKQIRTINFEVIFPEGFEVQGERVAKLLDKSYEFTTYSLNHKPKKVSVVLHTESSISNASLGWAPSRIDMYTVPPQNCYSQDWFEQLAIHEFRHLIQLSKIESEMPALLRYIFGEQAAALLTGIYLPFWFIEGDAVSAETGLSNSGRGRVPDFQKTIRAQLVEKGKFNYDKAYLGSYKDNVANYYELGYLLVAGARERYNDLVWDDVISNVADKPFSINAFDRGLKKATGLRKVALYDTIFNGLKKKWIAADKIKEVASFEILSPENYYYTDYKYCAKLSDGNFLTYKSGLSEVSSIVKILEDGNEEKIITPGYIFEKSLSANKNLIVWCEYENDLRWSHAGRSVLKLLDINSGKTKKFKLEYNVFAPTVSPDLKFISAVEVDDKYRFSLIIIDIYSGEIIKKINTPDNDFFITPSWGEDEGCIFSIALSDNKKKIIKADLSSGDISVVKDFGNLEIDRPKEKEGFIYFIAGFTGTDELFAINEKDEKIYKVLNSRFGIQDYSFDSEYLTYNDYSSDGYRLVQTRMDTIVFQPFDLKGTDGLFTLAETLSNQEGGVIDFQNLDNVDYKAEKYIKLAHLFKFHSWAPLSIDAESYSVYPGISAMSQNILGTAETSLGYRYKWDKEKGEVYANYKYYGWYPVFEGEVNYGKSKSTYKIINQKVNGNNNILDTDTVSREYTWKETNLYVRTYVPFNLSRGNKYQLIYPYINYQLTNYEKDNDAPRNFPDGNVSSVETGLYMYSVLHSSEQDLLPNFGVFLDVSYTTSIGKVFDMGSIFSASGTLYLPGVIKNHGVKINNSFQSKISGQYTFNDKINFPRGHTSIDNDRIYKLSLDYLLPLFYPDKRIGGLAYFKRIKADLFYDYSFIQTDEVVNVNPLTNTTLQSAGVELTTDVHFLRFIFPFELGVRTSYLFNKKFNFDFIFNVNFSL
jgi:hypothetical protein